MEAVGEQVPSQLAALFSWQKAAKLPGKYHTYDRCIHTPYSCDNIELTYSHTVNVFNDIPYIIVALELNDKSSQVFRPFRKLREEELGYFRKKASQDYQ